MQLMDQLGKAKDPASKLSLCNQILQKIEALEEEARLTQEEIDQSKAEPLKLLEKIDQLKSIEQRCPFSIENGEYAQSSKDLIYEAAYDSRFVLESVAQPGDEYGFALWIRFMILYPKEFFFQEK